ncbi:MAG: HAD family hydrolase [Patescibacteria group bacterium]
MNYNLDENKKIGEAKIKPANCVVDFDETLLSVDSTAYIIKNEKLYFNWRLVFWVAMFFLVKFFLPRRCQFAVRQRAKYAVLNILQKKGQDKMITKYAKIFSSRLDFELINHIQKNYSKIYVISSAWQPLILATLASAGVAGFQVIGTVMTQNFADFRICWYTNKVAVIQKMKLDKFDLFTDSDDDRPLMKLAQKVTIV